MKKNAFTLIELLVVISIIAVLSTIGLITYQGVQSKTRDSVRKSDLTKLATALELYLQKNGKYIVSIPTSDGTCTGTDTTSFYSDSDPNRGIRPFMSDSVVPKDPKTQALYCYISVNSGQSFRLFAKLENCTDSSNPLCSYSNYNYSIVSDNITLASALGDTVAPTAAPISVPTTTVISDSFNRADSTSLGNTDTGQPWIVPNGSFGISSNQTYRVNGCPAPGYAVLDSGVSDATIQVTLPATLQDTRIPFRFVDVNNTYWIEKTGGSFGDYYINKMVGGVGSALAIASIPPANGDTLKIVLNGPSITLYVNNALAASASDSALNGTKHGIGAWCFSSARFDNFSISPPTPASASTPTPTTSFTPISVSLPIHVPVLVLEYYPPDPSNATLLDGNETGWKQDAQINGRTIKTWEDATQKMITEGITLINDATRYHGYKNPAAPQFLSYSVLDDKNFHLAIPKGHLLEIKTAGNAVRPDYGGILRGLNICDYVDNKGVKEVWMYGYHNDNGIVPDESRMSSKYGDISNSYPKEQYIEEQYRMPVCQNSYVLYNFTYQPNGDPGNNLHNRGHQIENIIPFAEGGGHWPPTTANSQSSVFWGDFSEYVQNDSPFVQSDGTRVSGYKSSCGNIHITPNWSNARTQGYIYNSSEQGEFNCETWQPDDSKTTYIKAGCERWGCTDKGFYKWFMQNMPGYNNDITYQGKKMRNWWEAMYDFNAFIDKGRSLYDN